MTNTSHTPAGWYPDPAGSPRQRWWDGVTWTESFHDPLAQAQIGTPALLTNAVVYNKFTWLMMAALYAGYLSMFVIDWRGYLQASISYPQDLQAMMFDTGYLLASALSVLLYAAFVVLAYFDSRELVKQGIPRPFHWAYAFFGGYGVYPIGRAVVMKRRTGRGMGTVWAYIGYWIFGIAASVVLGIIVFSWVGEMSSSSFN